MGFLLNGVNTGGIPMYLIEKILLKHEVPYFVETGTAAGASVRTASPYFKTCYTIEAIDGRQEIANAPDNILFFTGNSPDMLYEIVSELLRLKGSATRQFVLFWLDAHYSGDTPNETEFPECPLLDEIQEVSRYGEDAIILIDDARLFFGHPPYPNNPKEWPCIQDIFIKLRECFPYHYATITDDYILCVPIHVKEVIDEEWRSRYHIRYPNAADKLKAQAKEVFAAVKNYLDVNTI
jgi:hypothetical protein